VRKENYKQAQLRSQLAFLKSSSAFSDVARLGGGSLFGIDREFVLPHACKEENLFEPIRRDVGDYFHTRRISWHQARAHVLSSQVCCLNFLAPFSFQPRALKTLLRRIIGPIDEMLETERGRFVSFEFTGERDYLHEWKDGVHTRGANCTSVDAMVRFRTVDAGEEAALIEWKYTEHYGRPRPNDPKHAERLRRYEKMTFSPEGPIRADAGIGIRDLFAEPIFQLYRQQMLATQMRSDKELGLDRVRTVLIAPRSNLNLYQVKIPSFKRFGPDLVAVWRALLSDPDGFVFSTTEDLFGDAKDAVSGTPSLKPWYEYMANRYRFH
jgi:hypothetical protein